MGRSIRRRRSARGGNERSPYPSLMLRGLAVKCGLFGELFGFGVKAGVTATLRGELSWWCMIMMFYDAFSIVH